MVPYVLLLCICSCDYTVQTLELKLKVRSLDNCIVHRQKISGTKQTLFFQIKVVLLAGAKRQALQVTSSQEAEEGGEFKIEHNSLNFWARSLKFCMEVRMDSPNKLQKYRSTKKYISTKVLITADSRFCMEVHMDCLTKWQSTKV